MRHTAQAHFAKMRQKNDTEAINTFILIYLLCSVYKLIPQRLRTHAGDKDETISTV